MHRMVIGLVLGAACNSSAPPAGSSASAPPAPPAPAPSGVGSCGSVPLSDLQVLLKDPITKYDGNPVGACNAYVGAHVFALAATIETDPVFASLFKPADGPAVAGVGDAAYYTSASDDPIQLHAKQGATYCFVKPASPAQMALAGTTPAQLAAYAQLEAKLCADMFAAH